MIHKEKTGQLVTSAKILGLNVSSDLKERKKAKKRLCSLSQLKRSGLGTRELVQFFCTCIRPITEYACPVFHGSLPVYLSSKLEWRGTGGRKGYGRREKKGREAGSLRWPEAGEKFKKASFFYLLLFTSSQRNEPKNVS